MGRSDTRVVWRLFFSLASLGVGLLVTVATSLLCTALSSLELLPLEVVAFLLAFAGNAVLVCLPVIAWVWAAEEDPRWKLVKDIGPYVLASWLLGLGIGMCLDSAFGSMRPIDDLLVFPPQFLLAGLGAWIGYRKRRTATEARNEQD